MASNIIAYPRAGIANLAGRWRIALAIIIRQMKIRSGEDRFGYVMEILEPILIISMVSVAVSYKGNAAPPVGDSYPLFIATGYLPYKCFVFISNDIRKSLSRSSGVLGLPIVQSTDAMVASLLLKSVTTLLIITVVVILMNSVGYRVIPDDPLGTLHAFFWVCLFSFGFGLVSSTLGALVPFYKTIHRILAFKLMLISGVFFLPELMPPEMRYYLAFNPLLHAVAWFRSAFISGFHSSVLDTGYLLWWTACLVSLGLLMTRVFRHRLSDAE